MTLGPGRTGTPSPALRRVAAGLGVLLVVAASVAAVRGTDFSAVRGLTWRPVAAMAGMVAGNLLASTLLIHVITRSFDARPPVTLNRMAALICAGSLLNYLPLRPGVVGRAAFLRAHHALPLRQSAQVVLAVALVTGTVCGAAAALGLMAPAVLYWPTAIPALVVLALLQGWLARRLLRRRVVAGWSWVPLKALDLACGSARLWIALDALGSPAPLAQAVTMTSVGMIVSATGLTPGGLGLREWAVGLTARASQGVSQSEALTAALVDRAVDVVVVVVAGLMALPSLRGAGGREVGSRE